MICLIWGSNEWFNHKKPKKLDDFSQLPKVETLKGRLPEGNSWLEAEDLQAYQAVSSSLKELPQSFQDEILSLNQFFSRIFLGRPNIFHMFFFGVKLLDSVDSFGSTITIKAPSSQPKWW